MLPKSKLFSPRKVAVALLGILMLSAAAAAGNNLRVVTYNIDADTGGADYQMGGKYSGPGLIPVLEAIGAIHLGDGVAQPIDVLALEEMNSPSTTAAWIVGQLNNYYGAGTYAYDAYIDLTTGGQNSGGGPSGLIYNTHTVQDLAVTSLAYGTTGAARAPLRYTLQPVGANSSSKFYLYISHMLSSGGSRQTVEATEIRNDAATLGASANIIYSGDFNSSLNESGYPGYNGMVAATPSPGQGIDPGAIANLKTEKPTGLNYRDDYQFVTAPVYNGTGNFRLVSGSYTAFGNNGTTNNSGNVDQPGTNTALNDLGSGSASAILYDLTTATDHLPVVADYAFSPPATIGLGAVVNATIITGGTGTLGATVANSAAAGSSNLNYTLAAAVAGGSATLGSVTPSSGTLAPSASQACTVAATSSRLGANTITFTASDPNASNSPQTFNATLTVLDHAAGSASVIAGNGFLVRAGATALSATISVSNAAGTRSSLQVGSAPSIGSGSLSGAQVVPYFISAGSTETYTATFDVGNTAGSSSNTIIFPSVGDDPSLPGARAPGALSVSVTGNVYSGNAVWTGSAASWAAGSDWRDAAGGPTAAPGTDAVQGHDTATFANTGTIAAIDLTGANPNLQALSFNNSNYTLSNGSLTLQSSTGTATVTVTGNTQTIANSTIVTLASPTDVVVATGAELDIKAGINEIGGRQLLRKDGSGTLVLSGTNKFDGGVEVRGGTLIVSNAAALADGSNLTVGSASLFAAATVPDAAEIADSPPGSGQSVAPVPEPGTTAILAMAAGLLAACAARRAGRTAQSAPRSSCGRT